MLFYNNLNDYIHQERKKLDNLDKANLPEVGYIENVLLSGENQDRKTNFAQYYVTTPASQLEIDYEGIIGDRHRNSYRLSTGRDKELYPKHTPIRGVRHLLAVSKYDCTVLSKKLDVEINPQLLGANLVIARTDNQDFSLSELPHGTYLAIAPEDSNEMPKPPIAVLVHYVKQMGCGRPGFAIAERYKDKKLAYNFVKSAPDNRGILCCVDYPVETTAVIKPKQKIYFKYPKHLTT